MSESKKFPAVILVKDGFLGLEAGTQLCFDWASGKYVSVSEQEEIAEGYYYSGFAIALDPYIVKDNIGSFFAYTESEQKKEEEELKVEEVVVKEEPKAEE
jgi:hypothetical protein